MGKVLPVLLSAVEFKYLLSATVRSGWAAVVERPLHPVVQEGFLEEAWGVLGASHLDPVPPQARVCAGGL